MYVIDTPFVYSVNILLLLLYAAAVLYISFILYIESPKKIRFGGVHKSLACNKVGFVGHFNKC